MNATVGSVWSGTTPPGAVDRNITPNALDSVVSATKTWIWTNGDFTDDDVGHSFVVANAVTPSNNGHFIIASVTDAQTILSVEAPGGNETFSAGDVTCAVHDLNQTPVLANDMEAYAASFHGGLFDFANDDPIFVVQIVIHFGSGTTSWLLELVDIDSTPITVAGASNATPYFANFASGESGAGLIILQGQTLRLTSVGGPTTAAVARISVTQYRG
jgi:hypothetical protein